MPTGFPTNPKEAARELRSAGAVPLADFPGVKHRWRSRCRYCKSVIFPRLADVRNGHRPCNYCAKRASAAAQRVSDEQACNEMLKAGMKPLVRYPGAGKPWRCQCQHCGYIGNPRLASIRRGHAGCRECSFEGRPKIEESIAVRTMIKDGKVLPLVPYPGNGTPWQSRCLKCGAQVSPRYSSVVKGSRSGCRYCARERAAKTRLTPHDKASREMIRVGATPQVKFPGTRKPWKCRCKVCARIIYPHLGNIRGGSGPCKFCAEHGFDYLKPAIVYLLQNSRFRAFKVGVTGRDTGRLNSLRIGGWKVLVLTPTRTGRIARKIESETLKTIVESGARLGHVPKNQMPYGGHTETIDQGSIRKSQLISIFKSTATRFLK